MAEHKRFKLTSIDELKSELDTLGLYLPLSEDTSILGDVVKVGDRILPNRFITQPMEGIDANEDSGSPSELTFRRYRRFAQGGAGLIWFEAVVVNPSGRSNPRQLMITPENLPEWQRLVQETKEAALKKHGHEITTVVQLTHSGRWSKPQGTPVPIVVHHNPKLDQVSGVSPDAPLITDEQMDVLMDDFVNTAELAAKAGFDGVELKAVHGYITGEMLCSHTRPGKYGGSYENRTRFVRECTKRAREIMPEGHFVTARLTMYEPSPYPYGWGVKAEEGALEMDLTEPLCFAKELVDLADMPVFNFSIGYPRFEPYMNRPFDNPIAGASRPPEHPLEGIVRFQKIGREVQKAVGDVPVATAALAWLRHLIPPVAAGLVQEGWVQLIGQGRQSFAYPDSVSDILLKGEMDPKECCLTCSLCSQMMKDVIGKNGCPIRDKEIYGPELKKGRAAAKEKGSA